MYGTLGFVDNDRLSGQRRSAAYIGSSGHPSRKEFSGASRPQDEMRRKLREAGSTSAPIMPTSAGAPQIPTKVAQPAEPTVNRAPAVPMELSMQLRRTEFLEMQNKQIIADMAEVRGDQNELRNQAFFIWGETMRMAPTRSVTQDGELGSPGKAVQPGQRVRLVYPMRRAEGKVWMRRCVICPYTASITLEWVALFHEGGTSDEDVNYITHFT